MTTITSSRQEIQLIQTDPHPEERILSAPVTKKPRKRTASSASCSSLAQAHSPAEPNPELTSSKRFLRSSSRSSIAKVPTYYPETKIKSKSNSGSKIKATEPSEQAESIGSSNSGHNLTPSIVADVGKNKDSKPSGSGLSKKKRKSDTSGASSVGGNTDSPKSPPRKRTRSKDSTQRVPRKKKYSLLAGLVSSTVDSVCVAAGIDSSVLQDSGKPGPSKKGSKAKKPKEDKSFKLEKSKGSAKSSHLKGRNKTTGSCASRR